MTRPVLYVLAGLNGASKISVGGHLLERGGLTWFNPDVFTGELKASTGCDQETANTYPWQEGMRRLEEAIAKGLNQAFRTPQKNAPRLDLALRAVFSRIAHRARQASRRGRRHTSRSTTKAQSQPPTAPCRTVLVLEMENGQVISGRSPSLRPRSLRHLHSTASWFVVAVMIP
jgi:hypothetical protein